MTAGNTKETLRAITRLDVDTRDKIAQALLETFASRGFTILDIERALLDAFGTLVQIKTWGRELGTIQLNWPDIGVPAGSKRAALLKASKFNPLPVDGVKEIAALFEQVRDISRTLGVWMTDYKHFYIPIVEWELWQERLAQAQAQLDIIKQRNFGVLMSDERKQEVIDILTEAEAKAKRKTSKSAKAEIREQIQEMATEAADYDQVKAEGLAKAEVIAYEAYDGLVNQNVQVEKSRDEFVDALLATAEKVYPSEERIRDDIGFAWVTLKVTEQEVIDVVVANRDILQHEDMVSMHPDEKQKILEARIAERMVRESMIAERREAWLIQAERSSLLSDLSMSAGKKLVVLAEDIATQKEPLSSGNSRKLNTMMRHWLNSGGMIISSKKADQLCQRALDIQAVKLAKRDKAALYATLQALADELKELAKRKALPTAGLGAGLVQLED